MKCVNIYLPRPQLWMTHYKSKRVVGGPYGIYFLIEVSNKQLRHIWPRLIFIKHDIYDKKYARAGDSRSIYLKTHKKKPYYCLYCDRRLKTEYMQVDHIVPVYAAQRSPLARLLLLMMGCDGVNDPKNLAASCSRCNQRKGARVGFWTLYGLCKRNRNY